MEKSATITDVCSTIWTDYKNMGESVFKKDKLKLNYLIVENEDSFIISTHLYGYIATIMCPVSTNLGMAKLHLESIVKFLYDKFKIFSNVISDKPEE